MNFLKKEESEYTTLLGNLLLNKKIINKKPFKTYLWLPKGKAEKVHMYFYLDNYEEYKDLSILNKRNINNLCFEAYESKHKFIMTNILMGTMTISPKAGDWAIGYAEISFYKHLLNIYEFTVNSTNEFIFNFSKSNYLKSSYFEFNNYNGEKSLKSKDDLKFDNLSHLNINKITVDTSPTQNQFKIDFLTPCKHFLQFYKSRLPIVNYIFSVMTFIEHRKVDFYKTYGVINNIPINYYIGNRMYKEEYSAYEMIDFREFDNFFKVILSKDLEEMKFLNKIITRFNVINNRNNTLENKITGLVYLLERIIRMKGANPDHKQKFLKEENIFCDDLMDIKTIKNVRNCISHGHEELPPTDLLLVYRNVEVLMQRIIIKELNWNFENSILSPSYLKEYNPFYGKRMTFKGNRKCLEGK
ncbi:MAG: hypothetical protein WA916_01565 [Arcobacter sp.]|uniref:hypothetical protein n=1 Tax=Arcobacter sp. TaxID=1872629 RepID=UPI003C743AE7